TDTPHTPHGCLGIPALKPTLVLCVIGYIERGRSPTTTAALYSGMLRAAGRHDTTRGEPSATSTTATTATSPCCCVSYLLKVALRTVLQECTSRGNFSGVHT
ncbi:unnamed protein product, partial [Pylaiella littoralis]